MRKLVLLVGLAALSATLVTGAPVDKKAINAAIERGVAALKRAQRDDGSWNNTELGATALAGLALVECDVPKTDPSVKSAAEYVRKHGLTTTHVYSLSLGILFLDRLDTPSDTPLIESMVVRLLAGQSKAGNWSYNTPAIADLEMKRIVAEMDGTRVLRAGGDLKKLPARGKRSVKDLPEAVQVQLKVIAAAGGGVGAAGPAGASGGDNSNTQFAVLALWTGRRYGVPTQEALVRAYDYFRATQNPDGGWAYVGAPGTASASTATMTCAGVLALAVGHGAAVDIRKAKKADAKDSADVSKDEGLKAGLTALGASIGVPLGWDGTGPKPAAVPSASGKSFYFLWSLERIAIALNLATIGKKDWYNWGAEILLANQQADGTWNGEYASYHADTCFALLFLKRSNLASDLGEKIVGLKDPGERKLKAGGPLTPPRDAGAPGIGEKGKTGETAKGGPEKTGRPKLDEPARSPEERTARELGKSLLSARDDRRREILEKLRDTRGVEYTETLAYTIPALEGEAKRDARQALTARLARMKDVTLADYLTDEDAEIRRAAALASGTKEVKAHVPALVKMLRDKEDQVRRAAHAALKATTGQKFELDPAAWEKWLRETRRE
jgi:hypothetical protein